MEITRERIIDDSVLVSLNWERPFDPYDPCQKRNPRLVDSVEFEICHKGIARLEENIDSGDEFVMCFVHFDAGTDDLLGIYMSIRDEDGFQNDLIAPVLTEEEKNLIKEYSLQRLKREREEFGYADE